MKQFFYRAKKSSTDVREGVIEAASEEEVIAKVNDLGLVVVDIREQKPGETVKPRPEIQNDHEAVTHVRAGGGHAVTRFYKQLSRMLKSGIPLMQALGMADEQISHQQLRKVIAEIKHNVSEGHSFSQALRSYPAFFPAFDIALMESGEMVGHLDDALKRISAYRETQEKLMGKIRGALAYPAFVLAAGIAAVIFLLCFVLPKFSDFFLSLGQDLPWLTRALITVSQFAAKTWYLWIGGFAVTGWIFYNSLQNSEKQAGWHRFYLSLPRIGTLISYSQLARFARTMSLLLESGIPLVKALESAAPVVTNRALRRELEQSVMHIKEGGTFSESLTGLKHIPAFVTQLVRAGEASGRLQESLNDIAEWYEQELQENMEMATKLLEPLLILTVGAFLGIMVIAVLLPIFNMNAAVS